MSAREWRSEAQAAFRLVHSDPAEAVRRAETARAGATKDGCLDAVSIAERALGLAAIHLRDLTAAESHLRAARVRAHQANSPQLAAEVGLTMAFALVRQGRFTRALAELTAALDGLDPRSRAQGLAQRGGIRQQLGDLPGALADYKAALPQLRKQGDTVAVQRLLSNRGVLHAFRHDYRSALRDLEEAGALCREQGLTLSEAFVEENLVLVHRRLGNVPEALRHLDRAERTYHSVGAPIGSLLVERSELLLSVRLFAEAREAGEQAVAEFARTKRRLSMPEARLLLARAAVLDDDPRFGASEARRARREFQRQGRAEWVVLARAALLLARLEGGGSRPVGSAELARAADQAEACAWANTALELRLRAGQLALARGGAERTRGRQHLAQVSAARLRGPAERRARGWFATALLRADAGDRAGCLDASKRGLRVIDEHRSTMAATDLRVRISGLGTDLARLGLRTALHGGSPRSILQWAELGRARQLQSRPALPPTDVETASLLAQLRALVAEMEESQRASKPVARLVRRQVQLEHAIRDATRRHPTQAGAAPTALPSLGELSDTLDGARLVELFEVDGQLHAVCLADGRASHRALGSMATVADLVRWFPFTLARLARAQTTPASAAAAVQVLRRTAEQLDHLLFDRLAPALRDEPLVVVPTGILQSVPWSLLPSLRGRPVTVAPSAGLWQAAMHRVPTPGRVVVVAGPDLAGAHEEAHRVAALHERAALYVGAAATVDAVTQALPGAALVHLAAHGTVRADNPLFSSLRLSDGPLTVYDLERLPHGADCVVLASCDSARDVVLAGDEMLGLSAAFLSRDTRHVLASVVPLPDAATAALMVGLHRLFTRGTPFASALAQAQSQIDQSDPASLAAAAGFVCIGAGLGVLAGSHPRSGA